MIKCSQLLNMCNFAEKKGSRWYCPQGLVEPTKTKKGMNCDGGPPQWEICGNLKNKGISDYHIHRRCSKGGAQYPQFASLSVGASQGSTKTTISPERNLIIREERNEDSK